MSMGQIEHATGFTGSIVAASNEYIKNYETKAQGDVR